MIQRHLIMASVVLSILLAGTVGGDSLDTLQQGVPKQLEQIQRGIDAVQNDVNVVARYITAIIPSDQSQTRFTPPVHTHESDLVECSVVNVALFRREIHVGLVDLAGNLHPDSRKFT